MYISLFGVVVIISCSVALCGFSNKYCDKKLNEYKELLSLLYTLKNSISTSGIKINTILSNIDKFEYPNIYPFFSKAFEVGLFEAFLGFENDLSIAHDDKRTIKSCFFDMGKNMLKAEIENIDRCINAIEESYQKLKSKTTSDKKVNNTVIICITLLVLILIA